MESYKESLLAMREALLAENLIEDQSDIVVLDQSSVGRLSRMDAMQTQQIALETKRRRQRKLQAIDGALVRIESGDFGYCFVCDTEISAERLRIDPTITRCKGCSE
ncbi:MAG: TraR/DksA family transcriptional regulator [Gammaproteobacteria bacterium]|nr:TraR/DksA family transcriptional regulator [Gammaproteobacteria bacterium]